ncbi:MULTISPECIES: GNAT family N-acetyltransferase [Bacteroidales]|uniref:GNAT family N-acetyltransferase n=1 Tax=Bacteroidales TaxID=171549 RepID=UPI002574D374|nr:MULTISPECIES: GNAT family N-acetyltransferase [Bacteroidales]
MDDTAFADDEIVAFTLNGIGKHNRISTAYDIGTGTIKDFRGQGIASLLLQKAVSMMKTDFIKILNIPTDDISLHHFLNNRNIPIINRQFEMILPF